MPTLRYIGPIDEVDVIGVGTLAHGDRFEASNDQAESLLMQGDNFEAVGDGLELLKMPELKELAAQKEIDVSGLKKKADLVAAIREG